MCRKELQIFTVSSSFLCLKSNWSWSILLFFYLVQINQTHLSDNIIWPLSCILLCLKLMVLFWWEQLICVQQMNFHIALQELLKDGVSTSNFKPTEYQFSRLHTFEIMLCVWHSTCMQFIYRFQRSCYTINYLWPLSEPCICLVKGSLGDWMVRREKIRWFNAGIWKACNWEMHVGRGEGRNSIMWTFTILNTQLGSENL